MREPLGGKPCGAMKVNLGRVWRAIASHLQPVPVLYS